MQSTKEVKSHSEMQSTKEVKSHIDFIHYTKKIENKILQGDLFYISAGSAGEEWQEQPTFARNPQTPCVGLLFDLFQDINSQPNDACKIYKLNLYTTKLKPEEMERIANLIDLSIKTCGISIIIDTISGELNYQLMQLVKMVINNTPDCASKICYIHNYANFVPTILKFQKGPKFLKDATFLIDANCFKQAVLSDSQRIYCEELKNYTLSELKWITNAKINKTHVNDLFTLQYALKNTTLGSFRAMSLNQRNGVFYDIAEIDLQTRKNNLARVDFSISIKEKKGEIEKAEMEQLQQLSSYNVFFATDLREIVQQHLVNSVTLCPTTCINKKKYEAKLNPIMNKALENFYQSKFLPPHDPSHEVSNETSNETIEKKQLFINTLQKLVRNKDFTKKYREKLYALTQYTGCMGISGWLDSTVELNPKKITDNSKAIEQIAREMFKDISSLMLKSGHEK
jgi:hypothetical protein